MLNSLEVRVPFLDHRLVEYAFSLPEEFKINRKIKKRILQDAFRSMLPQELYKRPKMGFGVPLKTGYQKHLRHYVGELLDRDLIVEQGIFNSEEFDKLHKSILENGDYDQNKVWTLLVFQNWWKKYMAS